MSQGSAQRTTSTSQPRVLTLATSSGGDTDYCLIDRCHSSVDLPGQRPVGCSIFRVRARHAEGQAIGVSNPGAVGASARLGQGRCGCSTPEDRSTGGRRAGLGRLSRGTMSAAAPEGSARRRGDALIHRARAARKPLQQAGRILSYPDAEKGQTVIFRPLVRGTARYGTGETRARQPVRVRAPARSCPACGRGRGPGRRRQRQTGGRPWRSVPRGGPC
jgi:hypothetical protein